MYNENYLVSDDTAENWVLTHKEEYEALEKKYQEEENLKKDRKESKLNKD